MVYSSPLSSHLVLIFCSFLSFSRLLSRHCLLFQLSFSSHPLVFGLFLLSFPLSLLFFILTLSFSLPVFPPFSLSVFNVSSPTLLPSDLLFHLLPYAHLLFLFPRLFILSSFLLLQRERKRERESPSSIIKLCSANRRHTDPSGNINVQKQKRNE